MYIKRDSNNAICALSQEATAGISEFLANNSPELQDYLQSLKTAQIATLENTDLTMARVLEDVINLLVDQGTIRFTDLPEAAQTKLLSRRELRGNGQGMNLLDDGDDLNI